MADSVFVSRGEGRYLATDLARGPWDPEAQHGGAPAALLVREIERTDHNAGLMLARVTFEFMRPVPLGELSVSASVVRPGHRVQRLEASARTPEGAELVRACALRVARTEVQGVGEASSPPGPGDGKVNDYPGEETMFATDAMEIRFVAGAFLQSGPATAWFRLRHPLVDEETPSELQRLAAAGDFGNGISAALSWGEHLFINPDLTLYVEREPEGEWICLQAETRVTSGAVGIAESVLFDERGRVGRAIQSLLVANR